MHFGIFTMVQCGCWFTYGVCMWPTLLKLGWIKYFCDIKYLHFCNRINIG